MSISVQRTAAPREHTAGPDFEPFLEARISCPPKARGRICLMMSATHFVEGRTVGMSTIPTEWHGSIELAETRAMQVAEDLCVGILYLPPEA